MTYLNTTRTVIVHGTPGPELLAALRIAGLKPLVDTDDFSVWGSEPFAAGTSRTNAAGPLAHGPHRDINSAGGDATIPHLLLTPEQAAEALGVGRTKLYGLMRTGSLPSVLVGGSRRVRRSDLDRFVDARAG